MKVLLTNDDGIDAPGLAALYAAVGNSFSDLCDIIVVAPDRCRSECGHSVTNDRALKYRQVRKDWISVDGTPVDCVRAAFGILGQDIDCVLSGVNAGANLGIDLLVSGTFAAAREAAMHGVAAMAVSHYRHPDVPSTWDHVPLWMNDTLEEFHNQLESRESSTRESSTRESLPNHEQQPMLWNVNLPAIDPTAGIPTLVRCGIDTEPISRQAVLNEQELRFESDFHARSRESGLDVDWCFTGHMTLSELSTPVRF